LYLSKKLSHAISFTATGLTIYFTGRFLIEHNPFNSPTYLYWIDAVVMCIPIYATIYAFLKLPAFLYKFLNRKL